MLADIRLLETPSLAASPATKATLEEKLSKLRSQVQPLKRVYDYVLDGANLDDMKDFRPGRKAAVERNVRSPLYEAGLTKSDVRALARHLGLPNWKD